MSIDLSPADIADMRDKVRAWEFKPSKGPRRPVVFVGGPLDGISIKLAMTYDDQFIGTAHLTRTGLVQFIYELECPGVWRFDHVTDPPRGPRTSAG